MCHVGHHHHHTSHHHHHHTSNPPPDYFKSCLQHHQCRARLRPTTKTRKESNASGYRRERENGKHRSQNRPHWWLHIKESCFFFSHIWSCRVFYFYFFVKCTDLGRRRKREPIVIKTGYTDLCINFKM